MMLKRILALAGVAVLAIAGPVMANSSNPNHPDHWGANCYKSEGSTAHGVIDGATVTLNTYQNEWPGDHWGVLVVKGGPEGRAVYESPESGVAYHTPGENPAGKRYDVSHWIVCKGSSESNPEPSVTPDPGSSESPKPSPSPEPSESPSPTPSVTPEPEPSITPDPGTTPSPEPKTVVVEHCSGWVETVTITGTQERTDWHHDAALQTCEDGENG